MNLKIEIIGLPGSGKTYFYDYLNKVIKKKKINYIQAESFKDLFLLKYKKKQTNISTIKKLFYSLYIKKVQIKSNYIFKEEYKDLNLFLKKNLTKIAGYKKLASLYKNYVNTTNYTNKELDSALDIVLKYDFDIIGFADTHGHLDLNVDIDRYEKRFKMIKDTGKQTAFHLHNHTGKAYLNYIKCFESPYIDICDTSIMSLGKGAGNLKLENVLKDEDAFSLNDFILKYYESLFKKTVSPYYLITGRFGITDHYATQARKRNMTMLDFAKFCSTVFGLDRDNFNKKLLERF